MKPMGLARTQRVRGPVDMPDATNMSNKSLDIDNFGKKRKSLMDFGIPISRQQVI